jgi:hypothetical protein
VASVSAPAPQAASSEWEEKYSEQYKRKYWRNKTTGKTTWNDPGSGAAKESTGSVAGDTNAGVTYTASTVAAEPSSSEWEEKYSEQYKRKYWRNKSTGKTTWTDPNTAAVASTSTAGGAAAPSFSASVASVSAPAPQAASSEWEEKYSEQYKRKYWRNKTTGKTTWNDPNTEGAVASSSASVASVASNGTGGGVSEWEEKYSEQYKRKYWRNKSTGKTTWNDPTTSAEGNDAASNSAAATSNKPRASELGDDDAAKGPLSASFTSLEEWDWEQRVNQDNGARYWYNRRTKETRNTEPPRKPNAGGSGTVVVSELDALQPQAERKGSAFESTKKNTPSVSGASVNSNKSDAHLCRGIVWFGDGLRTRLLTAELVSANGNAVLNLRFRNDLILSIRIDALKSLTINANVSTYSILHIAYICLKVVVHIFVIYLESRASRG